MKRESRIKGSPLFWWNTWVSTKLLYMKELSNDLHCNLPCLRYFATRNWNSSWNSSNCKSWCTKATWLAPNMQSKNSWGKTTEFMLKIVWPGMNSFSLSFDVFKGELILCFLILSVYVVILFCHFNVWQNGWPLLLPWLLVKDGHSCKGKNLQVLQTIVTCQFLPVIIRNLLRTEDSHVTSLVATMFCAWPFNL